MESLADPTLTLRVIGSVFVGISTLSLLISVLALARTMNTTPLELIKRAERAENQSSSAMRQCDELMIHTEALETRWDAFREAAQDILGSVEKKRRQAAASASRASAGEAQQMNGEQATQMMPTAEEQLAYYRAKARATGL